MWTISAHNLHTKSNVSYLTCRRDTELDTELTLKCHMWTSNQIFLLKSLCDITMSYNNDDYDGGFDDYYCADNDNDSMYGNADCDYDN